MVQGYRRLEKFIGAGAVYRRLRGFIGGWRRFIGAGADLSATGAIYGRPQAFTGA